MPHRVLNSMVLCCLGDDTKSGEYLVKCIVIAHTSDDDVSFVSEPDMDIPWTILHRLRLAWSTLYGREWSLDS